METLTTEATTLDKARAAARHAGEYRPDDLAHGDLLRIAEVQAQIAQAEALDRIADALAARPSEPQECPRCGMTPCIREQLAEPYVPNLDPRGANR